MTTTQRTFSWITAFAIFICAVILFESILLPFVVGFVVAYFLDPLCDRLEKVGCSRTVATSLVIAGLVLLITLFFALIVPILYKQLVEFSVRLPNLAASIEVKVRPLLDSFIDLKANNQADLHGLVKESFSGSAKVIGNVGSKLVSGLGTLANAVTLLIVSPVVVFYLLRDWDTIVEKIDSWLPRSHQKTIREQCRLIDQILAGFLRGQLSVCLLLGVLYAVGLTVLGLPFGAIVGLATGFLSFIPYVGMLSGFAVAIILAIVHFDNTIDIWLVVPVFLLGQVIEGNFLTPKLVGDRVNLHAVWILFALMAGGGLFGFVGILLAVPVAAVLGVMVRFALAQYLDSPLYGSASTSKQLSGQQDDA